MHTFSARDGRTLSYTTSGAGPLLVMLPGGPGIDPAAFYADTVLPGFRQLVFAPAGTGRTDPPKTPDGYRIAGYVDDVEELRPTSTWPSSPCTAAATAPPPPWATPTGIRDGSSG